MKNVKAIKPRLKELDKFLLENEVMPLIALHGYLTAAISSPNLVLPSQWMPAVGISGMHFASEAQAQNIIGQIMSFYNTICNQLLSGTFKPLISLDDSEQLSHAEVADALAIWARGYVFAVDNNKEAWLNRKFTAAMSKMLTPIMSLNVRDSLLQEEIEAHQLNITPEEFRRYAIEKIPTLAIEIYTYWRARRVSPSQVASTEHCGRNDPCPCGSGKKFKKCCNYSATR